jgi:hypothetical protein
MHTEMEVAIDCEYLGGAHNELVVKELSIAAKDVIHTLHFQSPYAMRPHGSAANGLNWDDGHIPYGQIYTVLSEAVPGYAHLYGYGIQKCKYFSELIGRPFPNLEDFGCPSPINFKPSFNCGMFCHKFPNVSCATRNAHSFDNWLMYHLQTKSYVKCPKESTRHTAMFVSAV